MNSSIESTPHLLDNTNYELFTLAERPELLPALHQLGQDCWPEFLLHAGIKSWPSLFAEFREYQVLLCSPKGDLMAAGHTVPVFWDGKPENLPKDFSEIFGRSIPLPVEDSAGQVLCAVAAMVQPEYRGQGLSTGILLAMRAIARDHHLTALIAPVRPTLKSSYPLTPIQTYMHWKNAEGAPFDPWIRVHWRMGAILLRPAPGTVTVTGTVEEWEEWTKMAFPETGEYIVPGALSIVRIDCERNSGRYDEPNVWMKHPVAE